MGSSYVRWRVLNHLSVGDSEYGGYMRNCKCIAAVSLESM